MRRIQIQRLGLHAGTAMRVAGADPGQNGPEPLDLDPAAQELREPGRRPLAGGERRRTAVRALGCSIHHGDYTRQTRSPRRTQRGGHRGGSDGTGRRPGVAEQVRRPCLGDEEHGGESKRHLRVPYLAAEPRASLMAAEEQRTGRLTAAAARRELGLGF
jgi:hypothetical protein